MRKLIIISTILVTLLFLVSFYFYIIFPSTIITHWGATGQPNGYMSKFPGVFLFPLIILGMLLLFIFLPKLDPLRKNYKNFITYYDSFILIFILFMSYIYIISILWNLGIQIPIYLALIPAIGFLFIYIGLILKHVKQNWFIGIRTPWSLSNEKVWNKTHKLGSKLFVISGIITLAGILFPPTFMILFILVPILASSIWLIVYSYLIYRKEKKR